MRGVGIWQAGIAKTNSLESQMSSILVPACVLMHVRVYHEHKLLCCPFRMFVSNMLFFASDHCISRFLCEDSHLCSILVSICVLARIWVYHELNLHGGPFRMFESNMLSLAT